MNLHKYWCSFCGSVEQVLLHLTPLTTLPPPLFNRLSSRSCYPLAFTEANIVPLPPYAHTTTTLCLSTTYYCRLDLFFWKSVEVCTREMMCSGFSLDPRER